MEIIEAILSLTGFVIVGRHLYSAYGFRSAMQKEDDDTWKKLGSPNPLAFFWWDLKRFKTNHEGLLNSNATVQQSFKRFHDSWKYGMPALLAVVVINEVAKKL